MRTAPDSSAGAAGGSPSARSRCGVDAAQPGLESGDRLGAAAGPHRDVGEEAEGAIARHAGGLARVGEPLEQARAGLPVVEGVAEGLGDLRTALPFGQLEHLAGDAGAAARVALRTRQAGPFPAAARAGVGVAPAAVAVDGHGRSVDRPGGPEAGATAARTRAWLHHASITTPAR